MIMKMSYSCLSKYWKSKSCPATPHSKLVTGPGYTGSESHQLYLFAHYSHVGKSLDICQADDIYTTTIFISYSL